MPHIALRKASLQMPQALGPQTCALNLYLLPNQSVFQNELPSFAYFTSSCPGS